ncbi:MAG: transglycosylase SLT domain-containing protein [Deltaproteobacteria bacterium]|nr:transglycosylase SLT domain-containing protein [Deltaproteobacteria bacterium]
MAHFVHFAAALAWCALAAAPALVDPVEKARSALAAGDPQKALAVLRDAGRAPPKDGHDPAAGITAIAAYRTGDGALALKALESIRRDARPDARAALAVEARILEACPTRCRVPVRSHADLLAAPIDVAARYVRGLTRGDPRAAAAIARAFLKADTPLLPADDKAARAELVGALWAALDAVHDQPGTAALSRVAWERFPLEPGLAWLTRTLTFAGMRTQHGDAAAVTHLEALSTANQNHEVVRVGSELCAGKVLADTGVCPALRERELACRTAFSVGKALRQVRRPEDGEHVLQAVAAQCPALAERARYLQARATMAIPGASARAVETWLRLAALHPTSTLADDALLLAGEVAWRAGNPDDARRYWERLLKDFPAGDMAGNAAWWLAWTDYEAGRTTAARARLEALAGSKEAMMSRRARYWLARLAEGPARFDALTSLVRDEPMSVEAALARGWLQDAGAPLPLRPALPVPPLPRVEPTSPPALHAGLALYAVGLDEDAASFLRLALADPTSEITAAHALVQAGDAPAASRHLRRSRARELSGAPRPDDATLWRAAYPRAHADALSGAAATAGVPGPLLLALAREESAFDPRARSPSGAVGLLQLLPATAVTEAMTLDIMLDNELALMDPALNARIGASYLARVIRICRGSVPVGLAGYNAGPGNARAWLLKDPDVPLDLFLERIPVVETRDYVRRVLDTMAVYAAMEGAPLVLPVRAAPPPPPADGGTTQ